MDISGSTALNIADIDAAILRKAVPSPAISAPSPRTLLVSSRADETYTPPPPPLGAEEDTADDVFEDVDDLMIMKLLEKLKTENKAAERLIRRQSTAIQNVQKIIVKKRATATAAARGSNRHITTQPAVRKCQNCKRLNRKTSLCGPHAGKACTYCTDHGFRCEGPATDDRSLWKMSAQP